jgi:hypothetical protein
MRTSNRSGSHPCSRRVSATSRTAVYGPVRTVVWEGWSREAPPYPDLWPEAGVGRPDPGTSGVGVTPDIWAEEPNAQKIRRRQGNPVPPLPPNTRAQLHGHGRREGRREGESPVSLTVSRRSLPDRGHARPSRGRSDGKRPATATAFSDYFPPRPNSIVGKGRFASRSKIVAARRPPLRYGRRERCSRGPPAVW